MSNEEKLRDYLRLVTANLQQTRRQLRDVEEQSREPVAIVGMGCRFPGGVRDPEGFWDLLTAGSDAVSGLPGARGWDLDGMYHPDPAHPGTSHVRSGGFVHDAGDFDPGFFGISPREALAMDPQQRLLLETSWEALERAAIEPGSLRGSSTGVFAGASFSGYGSALQDADAGLEGHLLTGTANSVISGRIAFSLGLEGPAVSVDTACSSSLVALHLAVRALRAGECGLALAGAVTVLASPTWFVWGSRQLGLAPDGRCKAFSAHADGMGLAEGAGVLVLERLSDARRNGRDVLAVITGSAVNQDGASNGLTAPNGPSQQRVIQAALASAGLTPHDVDAVEAHGTGTELGDPIEAQALLATYGQDRDRPLWTGSVKSNIGHTQAAAGMAGVIKMVQALRHEMLPRTLHVEEPSPLADWSGGVRLLTEAVGWPAGDRPRRAGVSSFGMSGTNAHVILEEASPQEPEVEPEVTPPVLTGAPAAWLVSGRSAAGLSAQAGKLAAAALTGADPADVAWSLATTRSTFEHRAVVLGGDAGALTSGLAALAAGEPAAGVVTGVVPPGGTRRVGFLFAGQGAQKAGMGRDLYAASPVFAAAFDRACALLEGELGLPVRDVVLAPDGADDPRADQTVFAQAGLFAVETGLVAMLAAAGIVPDAVAGHSVGEIAAAHAAGVLSLADACVLVAARARSMQALPEGGAMAAVEAAEAEMTAALDGVEGVELAAVNGPSSVVISGDEDAVVRLAETWRERGRRVRRLRVSHAFHSARMDPALDGLAEAAAALRHEPPAVTWAGALTGELVTDPGPGYWTEQARRPVRFADVVATLAARGVTVFVEIGPDATLSTMGAAALAEPAEFVPVLRPGTDVPESVLTAVARAHVHGVPVDWAAVLPAGRRTALPTYAFARRSFWASPARQGTADGAISEAERRFWAAVETGDLATLALDGSRSFAEVLPDLWSWRQREHAEAETAEWRYRITWEPVSDPAPARLSGTWLVVGDPGGLGAEVASVLAARGAEPVVVTDGFADAPVAGVVSLLAFGDDPARATADLVRKLDESGVRAPIWALTREAMAAGPGETPADAGQASVWGLGRVVAIEHPERWGGLVDLPAVLDEPAAGRLAAVLAGCGEDQVAIRGGGLLGRRLTRAPLTPGRTGPGPARGTVLISGDAGAIGATTAHWLAGRGADHVVLAGRSGPGPATVARLAQAGVAVSVFAADLDRRDQAEALLDRVGPALTAVFHAADDDGAAAATWLDELTHDLDAFVLFSSVSATWGGAERSASAATGARLDALAETRRARGLPATSIAWGPWEGTADGAALRRRGLRPMDPSKGMRALEQALGDGDTPVTVADVDWPRFAAAFTLRRPSPLIAGLTPIDGTPAPGGTAPGTALGRRLTGLPEAEQIRLLVDLVRARIAGVLGHLSPDDVQDDWAFSDLGFDSLTAVELRDRLAAATGLRLPATLVFDHPTPLAAARFLRAELTGETTGAEGPGPLRTADPGEPIAIVGIGCRFPGGADTPEALWALLEAGADVIGAFPADRGWPTGDDATPVQAGGFLPAADEFDPGFFGISPREALTMDPQQRLLLETSWEALERAAIDPSTLRGSRTGVFVGGTFSHYGAGQPAGELDGGLVTGTATSVLSGRVSYALGLEGPALTVDSACSSGLVALHLAAQALRAGECALALAGAAYVTASPLMFTDFSRQLGLSDDGRCKAFAAGADGMGVAEGAGVLVVERLSDARRNGHPVLALVTGSAMNQDGASNGLTAPNGPSQQRVIRAALESAGVRAADVDAVEAHGTGTPLGDPIEAQALLATYGQDRDRPLWLGSVKSNIGHAQQAAGVAGLIKTVLALRNGLLPRTLHAEERSPHIDWSAGDVRLLTEARPWPRGERPRRAGVSAFGISGTNAHVILQEAPADEPEPVPTVTEPVLPTAPPVWLLSARSEAALAGQARRLASFAEAVPDLDPADVAWSLAVSRARFPYRAAVVGTGRDELVTGLAAVTGGAPASTGKIVFVFPGQGTQWTGMGRDMLASPVFAARLAECGRALAPHVGWDLEDVLLGRDGAPGLERADVVQPVLWAVMVSLAATWEAAGVRPDAVVGHSQGEIAAACVAGILSLDDAARVVALRSRALSGLASPAGMLSVVMPVAAVEELLAGEPRLSVAAVNGPAATVVSGDLDALDAFERRLSALRVLRWRIPQTDFVAHSTRVEALRDGLIGDLAAIEPKAGRAPLFSSVTGARADGAQLDAAYWYANVRERVRFQDATEALAEAGFRTFVEVSPHPVLTTAIAETFEEGGRAAPLVTGTVDREDGGPARFLSSLARVHVGGVAVDWARVLPAGRIVDLPTYAFQRQKYWLKSAAPAARPDAPATDDWRYRVAWTPVAVPADARLTGTWLLVTGGDPADAVARALTKHGAQVVALTGDLDRDTLAGRIRAAVADRPVAGVLSLLALDESPLPGRPAVPAGLAGTLTLVQALGDAGTAAPLWVATSGAVATTPGEPLTGPAQAQTWGLSRVAALEHPDRWGGLVDLPADLDEAAAGRLAAVLAGVDEDQVAIRDAGLLARRLVRAPRTGGGDTPWTTRGSVLITGGTGAIGGHVARWLADAGTPRLVLLSRSGPAAPGVAALAAGLAARGAAVEIVAGDGADRASLTGLLARIAATGPALSGVMHTAGVVDNGVVDRLDPARLSSVLTPKAGSAALLDELTAGLDLDAFVLFSSAAATFGAGGQGNYAAANHYLDALAQNRRSRGLPALSVAWGPWAGGGVASASEATRQRLSRNRWEVLMEPRHAVRALADALGGPDGVLTVIDIDWELIASSGGEHEMRRSPFLRDLPEVQRMAVAATAGDGLAARLAALPRAAQEQQLVALVQAHVADVLAYPSPEAVRPSVAFSDLGFDSLTAVELRNRLSAAVGLRLSAALLFDHPTAAALAEHLRAELLGAAPVEAAPVTAASDGEPIAIVGMGCRFPGGVRTPGQLWDLLASGGDAISGFPDDRGWDLDRLHHADPGHSGTTYARAGGFVHEAGLFDPGFFGISPREALAMDPQQRLLLEISWEALERAGIDPASLRGSRTGTFVGGYGSGYAAVGQQTGAEGADALEGHLMAGNATSVISGRVAYTLGLEGPAITVDTACSSSLVALHLAARALRAGDCALALAGGVTIMATPWDLVVFSRQRGLAPDGRSKAFGADADGMGMAEGAGVLVLERLSDAHRNGHPVLAVIRGSAVNQDGASNGLTAPNGPSQQRVIRAALADAGLTPADVDAVEAHGTGTPLGDPIEAEALMAAYGRERPDGRPLWLGSVKSNLGHTQAAAGVAGVMKTVLALRHGTLPRSLHADRPSPHVDWSDGGVRLLREPVEWPANGRPRRAGVSAFGISGTNAHTIVEEAPAAPETPARPPVLTGASPAWPLSARTPDGLRAQAARLAEVAAGHDPADLGWSLAASRSSFEHRAVVLGADLAALTAFADGETPPSVVSGTVPAGRPKVGFLFAGQGAQKAGMGRDLYAASPVFAAAFDEACALLETELGTPIRDVVLGDGDDDRADRTLYAQTGLFAVQIGLVALLAAAGVEPDAVAGHSVGEIAAAHAAGVLSLADAARLVAARARLMEALPEGGAMAAIEAREDELDGGVAVAAVNGPTSVVVSGDEADVDEIVEHWRARGRRVRRLRVSHAFHSARMDPILNELADVAARLEHRRPAVTWAAALDGTILTDPGPEYWPGQAREAVRFADAVAALAAEGVSVFVEIGPDGTLSALGPAAAPGGDAVFVPLLKPRTPAADAVLAALARVHVRGVSLDWTAVLPAGNRVELPTYAFRHQRFWALGPHKLRLGPVTGDGGAEERLWAAVESGDRPALSEALAVDDRRLDDLLPVLADWRRRERDRPATDAWRYRVTWAPVPDPAPGVLSGDWLLVAGPGHDLAQDVRKILEGHGARVVEAAPDTIGRGTFAGVVSLLALDETPAPGHPAVARGLAATQTLIQDLGAAGIDAPLWVLTAGAVAADAGDRPPRPVQAQVWGLGRVAGLEHPERWGGLVDLPPILDDRAADRLCAVLAGCGEDQVAVRGAGLRGRRLVRARRPRVQQTWTPRGSVLITGGTGAIGGHAARWLAGRGAPRVVLTSRSGPAARGAAALAAELAAAGTSVDVVAADVARRADVAGLLGRIAAEGPPLTAVLHAAGAAQATALRDTTVDELAALAAVKTAGTVHLDELTGDLDAFVLFSSVSAIWGSGLHPGYAAVNAFLDALAENRRARGLAATSVAWGPWDGDGMSDQEGKAQMVRRGLRLLDPALGIRALAQALDGGEDLLTVADVDWAAFAPTFTLRRPSPLIEGLPEVARALEGEAAPSGDPAGGALAGKLAALPRAEQDALLVELVRAEAAGVLSYPSSDDIPADRAFSDLGADSLTAVELRDRLGAATGLRLTATLLFDHTTPVAVAGHLRTLLAPDGTSPARPVLAELDKIETMLSALAGDDGEAARITARLEAVVARWKEIAAGSRTGTVAEELDSSSDEEVFDFIGKELGIH
uniref:type I polyketide synthase n=1 Tax=Herbidospora sakaeratensis TaxID=564415 RepID=UPI000785F8A9|nr:type I polyketide synthase [Herbidospora sakaeratensis]